MLTMDIARTTEEGEWEDSEGEQRTAYVYNQTKGGTWAFRVGFKGSVQEIRKC